MPSTNHSGYTLIELLVVISIISILAVVGFVNFKNFATNQVTVKAQGEVQTLLRLAQSNATSSTLCNNQPATSWSVKFTDPTTIQLRCYPADYLQRPFSLVNAQVAISGSGCSLSLPVTLNYSVGVGKLTVSPSNACSFVTFTISNTSNPSAASKTFTISKGGAIDVQ